MNKNIRAVEILSPSVAKAISERVLRFRHRWTSMYENSFYLGRPYYTVLPTGTVATYHVDAKNQNVILERYFSEVRRALCKAFLSVFPGKTVIPRSQNLTRHWVNFGFSISDSQWTNGGGWHLDTDSIHYPQMLEDENTNMRSVVLYLEKPETGGETLICQTPELGESMIDAPWGGPDESDCFLMDCKPGYAIVFNSFCLHKVMPMTVSEEHPRRMVAVAHFLELGDKVEFWI